MTKSDSNFNLRLIDKAQLRLILSWSDASIDRMVRTNPNFPRPIQLGVNSVRWRLDEVNSYINSLEKVHYDDHAFDPNA